MTMAVCAHLDQIKLTEPRDGPIQVGCQAEAFVGATQGIDMRLISMQELKEKLDRGDPLKLVNALGEWEYRAKHIPGSLHFPTPEETLRGLGRDDEIVVHCSNPSCMASVALYQLLERNGYRNIRRFAGGLQEWEEAGYPLEGEIVDSQGDGPRTARD
jgi:rhodanese-related sulfurtransferase